MKRLVAVLGMLLVLPAFAEVRPVFYEEDFVETDASADGEVAAVEVPSNMRQLHPQFHGIS